MTKTTRRAIPTLALLAACSAAIPVLTQQPNQLGYDDTPMQPSGKWRVHDSKRPQPRVITPGPEVSIGAPSDATVLLGPGADTGAWQMSGGAAITWPMKDGVLQSGKGMIETKEQFSDVQLHVEFATPTDVKGDGQGRGNSGVFLSGAFEIQVLDSYQNKTYPDGQAVGDVRPVPAAGERLARPGPVAGLRHRLHRAAVRCRRGAREAGSRHRVPQRRAGAQRDGVLGSDRSTSRSGSTRRHTRKGRSAFRITATP